jgi:hypothetical protein
MQREPGNRARLSAGDLERPGRSPQLPRALGLGPGPITRLRVILAGAQGGPAARMTQRDGSVGMPPRTQEGRGLQWRRAQESHVQPCREEWQCRPR